MSTFTPGEPFTQDESPLASRSGPRGPRDPRDSVDVRPHFPRVYHFVLLQALFYCHRIVTWAPPPYSAFFSDEYKMHTVLAVAGLMFVCLALGLAIGPQVFGKRLKRYGQKSGQKYCLLVKLTGNALAFLVLGSSTNLHWAFAGCFLIGLLNVSDELQALAKHFQLSTLPWSIIGLIVLVVCLLLDLFADPAQLARSYFGSSSLLKEFLYHLLNLLQFPLLVLTEGLYLLFTRAKLNSANMDSAKDR